MGIYICKSKNKRRIISKEIPKDNIDKEANIPGHSEYIPIKNMEIILKKTKINVFQIIKPNLTGTGFTCIIPFPDQLNRISVLITCDHVLKEEDLLLEKEIKLKNNEYVKKIRIDKTRLIYNDQNYDITIIEIKKNDGFDLNSMLEIDYDNFHNKDLNTLYKDQSIILVHYPLGSEASISNDVIKNIDSNNIRIFHQSATEHGSSGSPIINSKTLKVIGLHIGKHKDLNINLGTLLKKPIEDFYDQYLNNNDKILNEDSKSSNNNEILLNLKIDEEDLKKEIFFLDNSNYTDNITKTRHYHNYLKELNKTNVKLFIDEKECQFKKSFKPQEERIYKINIKFDILMQDCSYIFFWCKNIISIDLSNFKTQNITNMSEMFSDCRNLQNINLSSFNTENVVNMKSMFCNCEKLNKLDLSSFNTKNVTNMSSMFFGCKNLKSLDLLKFDIKNVTDINHMFSYCENLECLNLSNFDIQNIINMEFLFSYCKNLKVVDISSFNNLNDIYIDGMFYDCSNLSQIILNKKFYKRLEKIIKKNIEISLK